MITCWACGAARYRALPAWFASITHRPGWPKVTVAPEIEHTAALPGAMLRTTELPDAATRDRHDIGIPDDRRLSAAKR